METEAEEIKFEVARCRPRLTENFFSALKSEIGKLKFIPSPTADDTKKVAQLEILEKSILAEKGRYFLLILPKILVLSFFFFNLCSFLCNSSPFPPFNPVFPLFILLLNQVSTLAISPVIPL